MILRRHQILLALVCVLAVAAGVSLASQGNFVSLVDGSYSVVIPEDERHSDLEGRRGIQRKTLFLVRIQYDSFRWGRGGGLPRLSWLGGGRVV